MTQIVLEIESKSDTKLFLDLAERLSISFKTNDKIIHEILNEDWNQLIHQGRSLDFLNNDEEDTYRDRNLKIKFDEKRHNCFAIFPFTDLSSSNRRPAIRVGLC